jgi:hypothetical protein
VEKSEILKELQNVLDQLSIDLKYGRGYFDGGLYRYKDQTVIYLNRTHTIEKHINILSQEIKNYDLGKIKINSELRVLLENPEDN